MLKIPEILASAARIFCGYVLVAGTAYTLTAPLATRIVDDNSNSCSSSVLT